MSGDIYIPKHLRRNATLGSDKLIYFERITDQRIIIPPVWWAQAPVCRLRKPHEPSSRYCVCGYVKKEANSAAELEAVSRRFERQKQSEFARVDEKRIALVEAKHKEIRSRINVRMNSAACTLREKDFLRQVIEYLDKNSKNLRQRKIEGHLAIEA